MGTNKDAYCPHYKTPDDGSKRCVHYIKNGSCSRLDVFMCAKWLAANGQLPEPKTYTPAHLSYSQISLYSSCPRSYFWRYVERRGMDERKPAPQLTFGKILHKVLELTLLKHCQQEEEGKLDLDFALRTYQSQWEASYLCGEDLYEEGARQLRLAIRERGAVSHWDILGVEQFWELEICGFKVVGVIDLVERKPGDRLLVTDYKTGMLPMPWELETALQLTLYDIACRKLYPWAKGITLELHQLRQGMHLSTERDEEQREAAEGYVKVVGTRICSDITWEATPGERCAICEFRGGCEPYRQALAEMPPEGGTLDEIAAEHLQLEAKKKAISSRLRETEKRLKQALKDVEEVKAGGQRWSLWPIESMSYPVAETLEALRKAGHQEPEKVLTVDRDKLKRQLAKLEKPTIVQLELEAMAKKRVFPRLWAKGGGR